MESITTDGDLASALERLDLASPATEARRPEHVPQSVTAAPPASPSPPAAKLIAPVLHPKVRKDLFVPHSLIPWPTAGAQGGWTTSLVHWGPNS